MSLEAAQFILPVKETLVNDPQFAAWKQGVEQALTRRYAINLNDAGIPEEQLADHFGDGSTAEAFVEWFGRKYDLTERSEFLIWT